MLIGGILQLEIEGIPQICDILLDLTFFYMYTTQLIHIECVPRDRKSTNIFSNFILSYFQVCNVYLFSICPDVGSKGC